MFANRFEAGGKLIPLLRKYGGRETVVIALLRGGALTAYPIARALQAPLYFLVIRKLGLPNNPEQGFGAIDPDGEKTLNWHLVRYYALKSNDIGTVAKKEMEVLRERERVYDNALPKTLNSKTVILVDDGLATGYTMLAAIRYAKRHGARKVVMAIPFAHREALEMLRKEADGALCIEISDAQPFAVGMAYEDFHDVEQEEIKELLSSIASE